MKHYKPMLAETAKAPFDSKDWIFEVKWDGIRAISCINGEISIRSRNDKELKHNFPELQELKNLVENAVIDGEIILMKNGKADFQTLLERSRTGSPRQIEHMANTSPATYVVFDMLEKDGTTLTDLPLTDRRKLLSRVLKDGKHIVKSVFVEELGTAYYEEALKTGVEGIMAKKKDSPYQSGTRSGNWLKIKRLRTCDCVIFGYTEGTGKRRHTFGALILGLYDEVIPVFVGKVGTGFTEEDLENLKQAFLPLETKERTLNNVNVPEKVTWTKPTIVSEIMYQTITKDERLRMPRFLRLRTDKMPTECTLDQIRQISLQEYASKRDFNVTTEPQGKPKLIDGKSFIVQEHHARRLHFGLRLEREGVMKSWAVPKGIPTIQGDKRLAVQTEDHPIEYAQFQGTIPKGHYGAGTVGIWDNGLYEIKTWEKGKIEFALKGKRFHGKYLLTRLKKADKDQWLLIKVRD